MKHFINLAQEDQVARTVNNALALVWQERKWPSEDAPEITGAIVRYVLAAVDSEIGALTIEFEQ